MSAESLSDQGRVPQELSDLFFLGFVVYIIPYVGYKLLKKSKVGNMATVHRQMLTRC